MLDECTVYSLQFMYRVQYKVYSVQYMYSMKCTVYTCSLTLGEVIFSLVVQYIIVLEFYNLLLLNLNNLDNQGNQQ